MTVKVKIYGLVIVNNLVLILHGWSIWWKPPITVSETRTYALSCSADQCIYILFPGPKFAIENDKGFQKFSLAKP